MTADVLKEKTKQKFMTKTENRKKFLLYFPLVIYYNPLIQSEQSL